MTRQQRRPGRPTGHFGPFGGRFVPEALVAALDELTAAYEKRRPTRRSRPSSTGLLRSTPAGRARSTEARRLAEHAGGARILLKREDLNHTGAHKINNVLGQALLTKRMGKTRVIAETGAGQHGVATATAAALLGLDCVVYMGAEDTRRQALNVARMQLLGAEVVPVESGSRTLKDAINEAMRDWVANVDHTHYLFGTAAGPHPFPAMVRDFQRVIGDEARAAVLELTGALPDAVVACVGGGSNAIGHVHRVPRRRRRAARRLRGRRRRRRHRPARRDDQPAARRACCTAPAPTCCRTRTARPCESHSISAGLDYPGVGPEHAYLARHRPGDVRARHRRRGDGRVRAALPHRGHHPGDRVRARARRRAAARPRARPGRRRCWSTSPAAATRTWAPPSSGSVVGDEELVSRRRPWSSRTRRTRPGRAGDDAGQPARRHARGRAGRGPRRAGRLPARPASPTSTARIDAMRRDGRRRLSTSSRSACPTATR